jgi:hypothetical protein
LRKTCASGGATPWQPRTCRTTRPSFSDPAAPFSLLSYGENTYKLNAPVMSLHAEESAIRRLPTLPKKRRLKKVDMLVVRVSKTGCVGCSKPCEHCLLELARRLPTKGYCIGTLYYTDATGSIVANSLINLWEDADGRHTSRYYRPPPQMASTSTSPKKT